MTMIPLVLALVSVTIAVIALALAPRLTDRRVVFGDAPDAPKPFGYRMSWFAVKSADTAAVMQAMGLAAASDEAAVPANWNSGIGTIYDDGLSDSYVFVSPPVKGWTFVAGVPLPHPIGPAFSDKLTPLLLQLGQSFPDVQYFASFPIIDLFGWARVHKGKLIRAFVIGEDGVILDRGRLTPEEKALGLKLFDLRGIKGRKGDAGGAIVLYPTEEQVLRLARVWSCSPLLLDKMKMDDSTGFIARVPASWRAERIRRAA
ncbi:MAG: hypothetical protein ABL897_14040 [Hyphomicrobium sp.]